MSRCPACLILTTTANEAEAQSLARALVEARLAGCVQIEPVRSVYRWRGEVCEEPEFRLLIKTRAALYRRAEAFIRARHSYEVPEILCLPVSGGSAEYLRWLFEQTDA